jgi:hypothetical protein
MKAFSFLIRPKSSIKFDNPDPQGTDREALQIFEGLF